MVGDKGLVIKDKAAHHAISAKFPKKIDNKGKTLVVQYEVKLQSKFASSACPNVDLTSQDGLECGGAYMKILQDNKALHREEFSNASPYIIMFGPDKCGATNKVLYTAVIDLYHLAEFFPGSLHFPPQESQVWRVRGEASQVTSGG